MQDLQFPEKRLQFFTGKGGVGKSSVVAGLAYLAAERGKRTLIVEIDTDSAMRRIFDVPFVGFVPMEMLDGIWAINVNPEEALAEYIEQHVKIERLARRISKNKILQYFFKAAPAVNEFVTINKVYNLVHEQNELTGGPAWDLILVDLPATGHAITFLGLTASLSQLIGVGPVRKMLDKYDKLFHDQRLTAVNLVTLPEEMPVAETIELYAHLKHKLNLPMERLYINATPDEVFDPNEAAILQKLQESSVAADRLNGAFGVAKTALNRQALSTRMLEKLAQEVGMRLVTLPRMLVGHFDRHTVRDFAHSFPYAKEAM